MHNLIDDQMQDEVIGHLASTVLYSSPTFPISPDFAQTSDTTPLRGPLGFIRSTLHSAHIAPYPWCPQKFRPRRRPLDAVVRFSFRALELPATVPTYIFIIKQTPASASRCSDSDRDRGLPDHRRTARDLLLSVGETVVS